SPPASPLFPYTTLFRSARLQDARRPVRFALRHALVDAEGTIDDLTRGHLTVTLPDIAPMAGMGGVALRGRSKFDLDIGAAGDTRSEEHTSELQSLTNLV